MSLNFDDILKASYLVNQDLIEIATKLLNRTLSIGTFAKKNASDPDMKTTTTLYFVINGIVYSLAAAATIDVSGLTFYDSSGNELAAVPTQTAEYDAVYLFCVKADGTIIVVKGDEVETGELCVLPDVPATLRETYVPFGALKVVNATNAFTPGTTNTDASGVTATAYDLSAPLPGITF